MEQQIYLRKLLNKRGNDALVIIGILFIVFLGISWYSQIDEVKEEIKSIEVSVPHSKLVNPDFSKEYYHKYTYLLQKKKTLIPFIATYDTLVTKDEGQWSRDCNCK